MVKTPEWHGKKVLHEDRWSVIYEEKNGVSVNVSKFLSGGITISADEIAREWSSWSATEKISFAHAFSQKPTCTQEDERILDFLMGVDDERVWTSIAYGLTRHSQKKRVLEFLTDRLKSGSEPKANYAYALGALGAPEAVPTLKGLHDRFAKEIAAAGAEADRTLILDFVVCCWSLAKLEGSSRYREDIKPFLDHRNKYVRGFSKIYFEGGPLAHRT
jgi:hypothetical protein